MNIVIVGAGETGRYVSGLLAKQNHNIVLIDTDSNKLEIASLNADLTIREGSGTDWQLLDRILENSPHLFIALTSNDQTNLVACTLAKNLGYPCTISRIRDSSFLDMARFDFSRMFDVDHFIAPEFLVAHELNKKIFNLGSSWVETFAHGAVQMRTLTASSTWEKFNLPLKDLNLPEGMVIALICRKEPNGSQRLIFPQDNDHIELGDEVTILGEADQMFKAHRYFGMTDRQIRSVVIVGGSRTAIHLAKILDQREVNVRLIEIDSNKCDVLSEQLPNTHVINGDGTKIDFLKTENVHLADAFIVSTHRDEFNLIGGLIGKECGCENVMIQLARLEYRPIAERMGIGHTVSPWMLAGNRILGISLFNIIGTVVSLYEGKIEILEIQVSMDSAVSGIPIADLRTRLPKDFLIAVIQNRGRVMIATGRSVISPGDTVVVVTHSQHIPDLMSIF